MVVQKKILQHVSVSAESKFFTFYQSFPQPFHPSAEKDFSSILEKDYKEIWKVDILFRKSDTWRSHGG